MPRIATWNVNSVKARLAHLLDWLSTDAPELVLLQETKCADDNFPAPEIEALGYRLAVSGQKTYNGVAILSRAPIEVTARHLPGDDSDSQARYIEGRSYGLRVASLYLPNGNGGADKYAYKLAWMARLRDHAQGLLQSEEAVVLGGDYNVVPGDVDCHDPSAWAGDALCLPQSRAAFRRILHMGYTDAIAALHPDSGLYTWWDYRGGAWQKDFGLRIDHLLLSPQAADRLTDAGVDRSLRKREKASDHTVAWCRLLDV